MPRSIACLADMARRPDLTTVRHWIEEIFHRRQDLEGAALASLIASGILRHEKSKLLWIIDVERFPVVNGRHQEGVKERLRHAILGDEIPDTRDIMLVSIAEPCGLLPYLLTEAELAARRQRIRTLCNLETISRKVTAAIAPGRQPALGGGENDVTRQNGPPRAWCFTNETRYHASPRHRSFRFGGGRADRAARAAPPPALPRFRLSR